MLTTDLEVFMSAWSEESKKTFCYTDREYIKEYVVLLKKEGFFYIQEESTVSRIQKNKILKTDEVEKLLKNDFLKEVTEWWKTPTELKTGNCECGSWVFGPEYPHADWCPLCRGK